MARKHTQHAIQGPGLKVGRMMGTKLEKALGLETSQPGVVFGPTGKQRKPHNKAMKRPLLGIVK